MARLSAFARPHAPYSLKTPGDDPGPLGVTGTPGDDDLTGDGTAETINGGDGRDVIRGLGGDDALNGDALSDTLYGGDGVDTLNGGLGGDILHGEADADALFGVGGADKLFGGDGDDQLDGGADNDRLSGDGGIDTLLGLAGNDLLDGGAGADLMAGGLGNDVYIVDDWNDQTTEGAGQGYDIVRSAMNEVTLQANVEGLELLGSAALSGTGNDLANNIQGNSGRNHLSGLGSVDTINGNDGDDVIEGGLGSDHLRGGAGADTFSVTHLLNQPLETDIIYDFNVAEGDTVHLRPMGVYPTWGAFEAVTVVDAFTGVAGQVTVSYAHGRTVVRLDATGRGACDYQLWINGDVADSVSDWLV